jgi:hypothetical protein
MGEALHIADLSDQGQGQGQGKQMLDAFVANQCLDLLLISWCERQRLNFLSLCGQDVIQPSELAQQQ